MLCIRFPISVFHDCALPPLGKAFLRRWWSRLLLLSGVAFFASRIFCESLTDLPRKLMCISLILLDADMEVRSEGKLVVSSYYVHYVNRKNYDRCIGELYIQEEETRRQSFHEASRWRQSNNRTLVNRTCQRQRLYPRPVISALNVLELLHQSDGRVACFCESELLANADAWSSIKW